MYKHLATDLQLMDGLLKTVTAQSIHYLEGIAERQTSVINIPDIKNQLDEEGVGTSAALEAFNQRFEKIMVASSGPRYWGFVTGGTTPAAIAGDWLATVYDQNPQTTQGQGDVSAIIEKETIQLLLSLFNLPRSFMGGFVTGATMSNFTGLAAGRQWLGKQFGKDFAKEGVTAGQIKVFAATPHSSAVKSLSMLGIGSNSFVKLKTMEGNREAMDIADLKHHITQQKGQPFILVTSAGTVNTVDYDNFEMIAALKNEHHFWWHVDAAFGAFAACSPQYAHLLNGWQYADSIAVDCHKWLNVPYENAFWLINEKYRLLQVETFQNSNAPYLGDPLENFNYLNFLPENSRRLKALPVWFSLMAYGKKGYQHIVENAIAMAVLLGNFVDVNPYLELLAPVRLNTVCFTLKAENHQEKVQLFLEDINSTTKVFMTPTIYNGKKAIRAAFVNWRTTKADIDIAISVINTAIEKLSNGQ